jgi:hypothetical protein
MKTRCNFVISIGIAILGGLLTACGGDGGSSPSPDPGSGGGDGITVSNAPASVAGKFIPVDGLPRATINNGSLGVSWHEQNGQHVETLGLKIDLSTGVFLVAFNELDGATGEFWACDEHIANIAPCGNTTIDQVNGVLTFNNQVLITANGSTAPAVTLNGTLKYEPAGTPPGPEITTGNNSALLMGAMIGNGVTPLGDLRKPINVKVTSTDTSFTVGDVYATRPSTNTDYAYIFVPITNTSNVERCFVKLGNITYRDASDLALVSNGLSYVTGSVALAVSTVFTNSCLAPGEKGVAITVTANIYSAVSTMEFTLDAPNYVLTEPVASVIPTSYSFTTATGTPANTLYVTVQNEGAGPALVGAPLRFHTWILLDDAGLPLAYGLTDNAAPGIVAAAGTATIAANATYDGPMSGNVLVYVNFEDASAGAVANLLAGSLQSAGVTCADTLSQDEMMECRVDSRNQQVERLKAGAGLE